MRYATSSLGEDSDGSTLDWIAGATGARAAHRIARIQSLWRGYGEVFRVGLDGGVAPTVIVKHVRPPSHARDSISDARKRRSYDVEAAFYRDFAPRCDDACRVARMYASKVVDNEWLFVLEDLDAAGFAERRDDGEPESLETCLAWLAAFHARFLDSSGRDLWSTGTYWHLDTRRDELSAIRDRELRELAPVFDERLATARFQTIVHGDAKEANFCFSRDGRAVAAVDFQYAGRGAGIRDVAYLLHGHRDVEAYLDHYFHELRIALAARSPLDQDEIVTEWRALVPVAVADFRRFLAGWRPRTS